MAKQSTKISDLIADDKNFNKGSEFGNSLIEKSFRKFGAGRSILIDKNNRIIAGNKSVENAMAIGMEDVQIIESDGTKIIAVKRTDIDLDSEQGREMALADNASAKANIVFDAELIEAELGEAVCVEWGIELAKEEPEAEEDDFAVPEGGIETDIVLGDLFEIGEHRLLCGDSTDSDQVAKLMNGQKADITFSSPPYNVGKTPNGNEQKYLNDNDNKTSNEYVELLDNYSKNALLFSDYLFSNIQSLSGNKIALIEHLYNLRSIYADVMIWDKQTAEPAMARKVLNSRFEYVYIFSNEAKRTIGKRDFRGTIDNIFSLNSRQGKEYAKIHKATFPIQLPSLFIENFTESSVIDLFCGTGTTMVASHQLKRKCYGMELDPKYCQVIIDRMFKLDPTLKIKRNGQPYEVTIKA
jgi:DNA modification methylase